MVVMTTEKDMHAAAAGRGRGAGVVSVDRERSTRVADWMAMAWPVCVWPSLPVRLFLLVELIATSSHNIAT